MNAHSMNRLLVRIAVPDAWFQGEQWKWLIQRLYRAMPHYDQAVDWLFPDYKRAAVDLIDALAVTSSDRVLDLGCGTGLVTRPAAQRARLTVGIDLTSAMLERQLRKIERNRVSSPQLLRGDVRFLPLADASFDCATTSFMLLHLTEDEKQRVFGEVARVLVLGGRFGCLTGQHEVANIYPSPQQWRQWLEAAGFAGVQFDNCYGAFRTVTAHRKEKEETGEK